MTPTDDAMQPGKETNSVGSLRGVLAALVGWWSGPAGGREVLAIALPMVASTMSWTLMTYVDRSILHKVSGLAMSAGFNASVTWFASLSLLWGICSYTSTFVSQYHGDGQPERIGPVAWQGVWLALLFAPLAAVLAALAPYFFGSHPPEMARLETEFFRVLCWAAPGMLIAQSLESFYSGRGRTWVVMLVDAFAVLVNLALAYIFVVGWQGFGQWGMTGAAWATTCAQWCRAACYGALVLRGANRRRFNTWSMRWQPALLKRLVRFGGPSGVQMMLDVGGFTIFVLLLSELGPLAAEATSAAFTVSHVAFMPVWGLGMATAVLVGQHLGEDRPRLAQRAVRTTLGLAVAYMGAISLAFVLAPNFFLSNLLSHGDGGSGAGDSAVRALATNLLFFVAAYNLFDAVAIIFVSALKGAGDTRFIMKTSVCMAGLLASATWAGITYFELGVYGCWTIITLDVWALALVYLLRYRQGKWRSMRVIDQVHHGHGPTPASDRPKAGRDGARAEPAAVLNAAADA